MRQEKRTETITYIVDESYRIQYMSKALAKQFSECAPGEIWAEKVRGRAMLERSSGREQGTVM